MQWKRQKERIQYRKVKKLNSLDCERKTFKTLSENSWLVGWSSSWLMAGGFVLIRTDGIGIKKYKQMAFSHRCVSPGGRSPSTKLNPFAGSAQLPPPLPLRTETIVFDQLKWSLLSFQHESSFYSILFDNRGSAVPVLQATHQRHSTPCSIGISVECNMMIVGD